MIQSLVTVVVMCFVGRFCCRLDFCCSLGSGLILPFWGLEHRLILNKLLIVVVTFSLLACHGGIGLCSL